VLKAGYRDWSRSNIQVSSDKCGAVATDVTVLLQPQ
jgi:hypothetical protein